MNERFKELWWKARIGYNEQNCDPEVLEKFAELIVQECLQLCINVHNDADRPFSVPGSLHCMEEIREHFGVEE
jgi:hypothetical protein